MTLSEAMDIVERAYYHGAKEDIDQTPVALELLRRYVEAEAAMRRDQEVPA